MLSKICGVRTVGALDATIAGGASHVGLMFYPPSPRAIERAAAAVLAERAGARICRVGVFVDPDDDLLDATLAAVALDAIQLHGDETPERTADVGARTGKTIIKALPVADAADIEAAGAYAGIADMLLFDAKPPGGDAAALPGGNALRFDWQLVAGLAMPVPWLLSGGLTPDNVGEAVTLTGAPGVDVSSGVESSKGVKDTGLIAAFLEALPGQAGGAR